MSVKRILATASIAAAISVSNVAYAAEAAPESPNIHGFFEAPFKTAYITPRGLVVENQGLVIQPVAGLVIPIDDTFTVIGGVWNSINTHQDDPDVGAWNELDPFITLSAKYGKFEVSGTYVPFISPTGAFEVEHNIEFAVKYTDDWFSGVTINPYAKFFWAVSGDSTVVLGRKGDTYDVELGISPTIKLAEDSKFPVTLSFPTFITVGPENFWGGDQNFGTFCTGIQATVPLDFIPARFGHWHASIGATYHYLINDNLVAAADLLGGGDDRSRIVGYVSIGFNF